MPGIAGDPDIGGQQLLRSKDVRSHGRGPRLEVQQTHDALMRQIDLEGRLPPQCPQRGRVRTAGQVVAS